MQPPQTVKVNKCRKRLKAWDMLKHILTGTRHHTPKSTQAFSDSCECSKDAFSYPLIDHQQRYTITVDGNKTDLYVAYGYFNDTSAKQLLALQQVFTDKEKEGHLHAIFTLAKEDYRFDGRLGQHKMIKLMLSTQSFDHDAWRKVAAFCFDNRYDVLQIQDCGSVARPSNFETNDKK